MKLLARVLVAVASFAAVPSFPAESQCDRSRDCLQQVLNTYLQATLSNS